jgi:methyl-accepting chemotaxis protein
VNWTVSRRIYTGFAISLLLILAVALLALWALQTSARAYEQALIQERRVLLSAFEARGGVRNANAYYLRYLLEQQEAEALGRDTAVATARQNLSRVRELERDPALSAQWTTVLETLNRWDELSRRAITAARAGDAEGALAIRRQEAQPARLQLEALFADAINRTQARTDEVVQAALDRSDASRTAVIAGLILALIVGVVSAILLKRAITRPLQETSNVLASSASQILATTTEQASGATESLAAVTQTAATVDEVVQTAEQAAERARGLASSAQRAVDVGREGRQAVEESVAAMEQVREQVEGIAGSIVALADQAQAIGEIIATVNDLAERTNLLALNAAIEAARAGDQGRGFAVVASEVKSLAEQSKDATVRVRHILGEIQRATSAAVVSTERGNVQVAEGVRQVGEAGQRIRGLSDVVAEAAQAAAQIAASAGQQSTGMSQIRQAIASIQQASQQNLAATRQAEAAAQELNRVGGHLLLLVDGEHRNDRQG